MATKTFYAKKNDTGRPLTAVLSGTASLAGATVVFSMRKSISPFTVKVSNLAAVIEDAAARRVRYDWGGTDLNAADTYEAEFEVTYSGGRIETHPNREGFELFVVVDDEVA